jgi:hypothetical protein
MSYFIDFLKYLLGFLVILVLAFLALHYFSS